MNQLQLDQKAEAGELETEPVEGKPVYVDYRVFINGFPKSGTHLIEQYVKPIAPPMNAEKPWMGSFAGNSWTEVWIEDFRLFRQMGWLNDGSYSKGHMGHRKDIEMFLWGIGASVLFIYRDPRDVAISQTHHILGHGQHPERQPFRDATKNGGGFRAALKMVIAGYQGAERNAATARRNYYSGVIKRWKYYAPWLVVPWVMQIRYEDAISNRESVAKSIVNVCVMRAALHRGYVAQIPEEQMEQSVKRMVENTYHTERSATFRKGEAGGWREWFDDEIKALWKENDPIQRLPQNVVTAAKRYNQTDLLAADDPKSWVVRLGYEEDESW